MILIFQLCYSADLAADLAFTTQTRQYSDFLPAESPIV